MELMHITTPERALNILRTGLFTGTDEGNRGMNAFFSVDGELAQPNEHTLENRGALMFFQWGGPVVRDPYAVEYKPNTLYDQRNVRMYVPEGTDRFLTLHSIKPDVDFTWSHFIVPSGIFSGLHRATHTRSWENRWLPDLHGEMQALIDKPISIVVTP